VVIGPDFPQQWVRIDYHVVFVEFWCGGRHFCRACEHYFVGSFFLNELKNLRVMG
jgi:hypothetical protein